MNIYCKVENLKIVIILMCNIINTETMIRRVNFVNLNLGSPLDYL